MKFCDMPYARPDVEQCKKQTADNLSAIASASTYQQAKAAFCEQEKLMSDFETAYVIAFVRHTINTEDEFYDAENTFYDSVLPELEESMQEFSLALYNSSFRNEFEADFGSLMFKNIELALKTFSPEIIPDMQEENKLVSDYGKLIASAQIDFQGEKRTLSQLTPYKRSADDEIRKSAWTAEGEWYNEHGKELDDLFAGLVSVRDRMAKKLGYENYIELGYYRMQRNCYDKNDIKRYAESVLKNIVPVADELMKEQAERTGLSYPLSFADAALAFRDGNPKPQGSSEDILAHAKKLYHELSPETSEFIDFMYENELMDVESRKGKQGGGYCISIKGYRCPFIFANFNGTSGDVEVMTHEAGHAFADYIARDIFPSANRNPSYESCEIHSMSMEFFAWAWAEGFFGKDTAKFKYNHLADGLEFIPYGTMVDRFQHAMYENPQYTPQERHDVWKKLLSEYMPWMKKGEIPFYGEGKGWQRQAHIYERPFYYIDYCLAQTVALQFWAVMQENRKDAWERYMKLVKKAGTLTFTGLVEAAGLEIPFSDNALKSVAEKASEWLNENKI